jgi:hypothetical protein
MDLINVDQFFLYTHQQFLEIEYLDLKDAINGP